jgi:hypothetical protein
MMPSSLTTARVLARHQRGAIVLDDLADAMPNMAGDEHDAHTAGGTPEEQILRQRLDRIAVLARRMVEIGGSSLRCRLVGSSRSWCRSSTKQLWHEADVQ